MTSLVDTNILVDHMRDFGPAEDLIARLRAQGPVRASLLTRAELRAGAHGALAEVDRLIAVVSWEPLTEDISDRAGSYARRYRSTHPNVGLIDYLIAATADVLGLELVTRNVRHFPMFPGLEPPY